MTKILETDPKLSIPAPSPIGRLYRKPGSDPLPVDHRGNVIVPNARQIFTKIQDGTYMPSITNVIDTQNKPYLQTWAAKMAATEAVNIELKYPGRIAQSPTKAIEYIKGAHVRDCEAAADQGTRVHLAVELSSLGKEVPADLLPTKRSKKYLDAWKAWVDTYQPEFLSRELTVFGETPQGEKYAGTADFVAKINGMIIAGDYKSTRSGLHNEVSLQLSAISHASSRTEDDLTLQENHKIDAAIAVHLDPKGFTVKQARIDDVSWETFCALRYVWTFQSFDGMFHNGKSALSHALVSPQDITPSRAFA